MHLNFQFREPLAPTPSSWDPAKSLEGLGRWETSRLPFTRNVVLPALSSGLETLNETSDMRVRGSASFATRPTPTMAA